MTFLWPLVGRWSGCERGCWGAGSVLSLCFCGCVVVILVFFAALDLVYF